MKRDDGMRWRYRTILFEFNKDTVFGDKYIDEEEVEKTLNEEGAQGWELVNVTLLREGLLAFCKKPEPIAAREQPPAHGLEVGAVGAAAPTASDGPRVLKKSELLVQYPRDAEHAEHAEHPPRPDLEKKQDAPRQGGEDLVGEIKIR